MTATIEAASSLDLYALYRYFDVHDTPLYAGRTGDLAVRGGSHIATSKWMQFTARSTVERHKTLADVKRAEREAIETEKPIFNKVHNNTAEARERLYVYLEGVGRLDLLTDKQRSVVEAERMRRAEGLPSVPPKRHGVHKNPLIGWHSDDETLKPWIKAEAGRRGVTEKAFLDEVLSEYRHGGKHSTATVAGSGNHARKPSTDTAPAVTFRRAGAAADCPHPKARINKGLCGACGTNVGTRGGQ